MTEPIELINAYAEKGKHLASFEDWRDQPVPHEEFAPRAFAALRAVLDVHQVAPGYDWCMHCTGGEHHEPWPCPTVRAITGALEAS